MDEIGFKNYLSHQLDRPLTHLTVNGITSRCRRIERGFSIDLRDLKKDASKFEKLHSELGSLKLDKPVTSNLKSALKHYKNFATGS